MSEKLQWMWEGPRRHLARAAVALALAALPALGQAPLDVRVALVVGNAAYPAPATLPNPANDARAMSDTLRGLGFEVHTLQDASLVQLRDAVARVRETLQGRQGIAMLYYAGHGVQLDWRNYMVPVDARLARAADVPQQAVDVGTVIEAFRAAGTRMNILVLDACRDNPFREAASGRGLAQLDAPPGTLLAFATAPGNVAEDGSGANGLYTQFLLQELVKPQSRIEDVFKRTRLAVRRASQGRQVPWESTSLEEDFMFNAGRVVASPQPDPRAREQRFAQEKAHWDRIKDSRDAADFYEFLRVHPSGEISELAAGKLELLDAPRIRPQADRTGQQLDFVRRFVAGDVWEYRTKDGLTGLDRGPWITRVHSVNERQAEVESITSLGASRGMPTHDGGTDYDPYGRYDPPYAALPAGLMQVGRTWRGQSQVSFHPGRRGGRQDTVELQGRVVARETVTVPAGTFDTYKVELTMQYRLERFTRKVQLWTEPNERLAVKMVHEERAAGAPDVLVRELVRRSRAR